MAVQNASCIAQCADEGVVQPECASEAGGLSLKSRRAFWCSRKADRPTPLGQELVEHFAAPPSEVLAR